jgi:hypothetical protein
MDHVSFKRDKRTQDVTGRVLVEAQDGGLLFLARDGVILAIQPEEKIKLISDNAKFTSLSREEISKRILADLPRGFRVYATAHYLIYYDTSPVYAQWCGALFERLHAAFTTYWTNKGFDLDKPEFPLVALLFADRDAYVKYTKAELGDANESIIGFFSMTSNRMTMYDLTGVGRNRARGKTASQINNILTSPTPAAPWRRSFTRRRIRLRSIAACTPG